MAACHGIISLDMTDRASPESTVNTTPADRHHIGDWPSCRSHPSVSSIPMAHPLGLMMIVLQLEKLVVIGYLFTC